MRSIANIQTRNDNYIDNAMLRIDCETNLGDKVQLGTYVVKNIKETAQKELSIKDYELVSPIYKMQYNLLGRNYAITGSRTFGSILDYMQPAENFTAIEADESVRNLVHVFSAEGVVYEAGSSAYECYSDVCSLYNVRMDVNGNAVLFEQYVKPSSKPVEFAFSQTNGTMEGQLVINTTKYETINDVVAIYNNNDITLFGRATAPSSSPISPEKREQYYGEKYDIKDMQPVTQARINEIAQDYLNKNSNYNNVYEFAGLYVGKKPGTVGTIEYKDSTGASIVKKCLIQTMDIELTPAMRTQYKLKEVNADE